jgi:hypothetical protein
LTGFQTVAAPAPATNAYLSLSRARARTREEATPASIRARI